MVFAVLLVHCCPTGQVLVLGEISFGLSCPTAGEPPALCRCLSLSRGTRSTVPGLCPPLPGTAAAPGSGTLGRTAVLVFCYLGERQRGRGYSDTPAAGHTGAFPLNIARNCAPRPAEPAAWEESCQVNNPEQEWQLSPGPARYELQG